MMWVKFKLWKRLLVIHFRHDSTFSYHQLWIKFILVLTEPSRQRQRETEREKENL